RCSTSVVASALIAIRPLRDHREPEGKHADRQCVLRSTLVVRMAARREQRLDLPPKLIELVHGQAERLRLEERSIVPLREPRTAREEPGQGVRLARQQCGEQIRLARVIAAARQRESAFPVRPPALAPLSPRRLLDVAVLRQEAQVIARRSARLTQALGEKRGGRGALEAQQIEDLEAERVCQCAHGAHVELFCRRHLAKIPLQRSLCQERQEIEKSTCAAPQYQVYIPGMFPWQECP